MEFPLDPNMAEWLRPRLNKRNPDELHWRRDPPEWYGSIDRRRGYLYSHLAETTCCLQCGAVPCPFDHDEHKRQKLADLEFVKQLAKERKDLKDQVNQLQMLVKSLETKLSEWMSERRSMAEQLRQHEMQREEWIREKKKMEEEIERIKMLNVDAAKRIQAFKKDQEKLRILSKRVQDLEQENASLGEENERFRSLVCQQTDEIRELDSRNRELAKENEQTQYRLRSLRVELDEAREELTTARRSLAEKTTELAEVSRSLAGLRRELTERVDEFNRRDEANRRLVDELRGQLDGLASRLRHAESDVGALNERIQSYLAEIEALRTKLARDSRFKKFVNIKRQYNELREKNESLLQRLYEHEQLCQPIQFMTARGRVKSAACVRRSASPPGGSEKRPLSARCSTTPMLSRPKWESPSLTSFEASTEGDQN